MFFACVSVLHNPSVVNPVLTVLKHLAPKQRHTCGMVGQLLNCLTPSLSSGSARTFRLPYSTPFTVMPTRQRQVDGSERCMTHQAPGSNRMPMPRLMLKFHRQLGSVRDATVIVPKLVRRFKLKAEAEYHRAW